MQAGTASIKLMADIADVQQKFAQVESMAAGLGNKLKGALVGLGAGLTAGAFAGLVKEVVQANAALHDLSIQTGASVAALGQFKALGAYTSTAVEDIAGAMNKLAKSMASSNADAAGAGAAVRALGLDFGKIKSMAPEDQMLAVAQAMDQFQDGAGKSAVAQALFGKEGAKLLPFLKDLADEHDKISGALTEQEKAYRATQAAMSDAFGDNLTRISKESDKWKKDIANGMVPALYEASNAFIAVTTGAGGFKEQISAMSRDGTFADWTRTAVTGLTYVADGIQLAWRLFKALGEGMGAYTAAAINYFEGLGRAVMQLKDRNFSGAARELSMGFAGSKLIINELGVSIQKSLGEETFGAAMRARMAEMKNMGVAAKETKKTLDFTNEAAAGAAGPGAFEKLVAGIKEKAAALELANAQTDKLTEAQKMLVKVEQEMAQGLLKLTPAQFDQVKALLANLDASEKLALAKKLETDALNKNLEAAQKQTDQINAQIKAQELATEGMGLNTVGLALLEAQRLQDAAAEKERLAAMMDGIDPRIVQEYTQQAEALRKLARAKLAAADKSAAIEEVKRVEAEGLRMAENIERAITDSLMRGFESGKGFFDSMWATIQNALKTRVLSFIINPVVGGVTGAFAGAASANAATGGAANTLNTLGLGGQIKNVYDTIAGGFTALGDQVAFAAQDIGAWLMQNTTGVLNEMGGTLMANAGGIGSFGAAAGGIGAGMMLGTAIGGNKVVLGMDSTTTSAIGTAIGFAVGGPLGAAVGGALGGVVNAAFGQGARESRGQGITGSFNAEGANVQQFSRYYRSGGWFSSSSSGTDYSAVSSELQTFLNGAVQMTAAATKGYAKVLGLNADAVNGITRSVTIELEGLSQADAQKRIADEISAYGEQLAQAFVGGFARQGESATQALTRLAGSLATVNQVFDTLSQTLLGASLASGNLASSLLDAFGGADAFVQSTTTYYQAFYSEQERTATSTRQLTEALAGLGLAMPGTRAEFRALVEAQDLTTQAGQGAYAALIKLAPVFDQITPAITALDGAFVDTAKSAKTLLDAISTERTAVANARATLSGPTPVMSLQAIRAGIGSINSNAPSIAGLTNANAAAVSAKAALDAANTAIQTSTGDLARAQTNKVDLINLYAQKKNELTSLMRSYNGGNRSNYLYATATGTNNDAYDYNAATNTLNPFNYISYQSTRDSLVNGLGMEVAATNYPVNIPGLLNDPRYGQLTSILDGGNANLANAAQAIATAQNQLAAAQSAQATATQNKTAADAAAKKAATDYAAATEAFIIEASKSVPKLQALREETLRWYQSQADLAALMAQSAGNLRSAVTSARDTQLSSAGLLAQQQRGFDTAYSMALSTSGSVQAGYADKLAASLPNLVQGLAATSSSRADWLAATQRLFAKSEAVAALLDANAPQNYQQASLDALGNIDNALAMLDDSTRAITRAIENSGSLTATGLRQVVSALGGTPAFGSGGLHTGGWRLVGENGPELEATGPARIFNAADTSAMFSGGANAALADELRALREEVAGLRAEARATAVSTNKTTRILERVTQNGDALQTVAAV